MFLLFYSDRAKKHVTECLAALAALASESPPQKRGPLSSGPVAVMCSSVLQDLRHVGHASIHRVLRRHQILPWLGELRQLRRRQEGSAIWSGRRRGRRGHPPEHGRKEQHETPAVWTLSASCLGRFLWTSGVEKTESLPAFGPKSKHVTPTSTDAWRCHPPTGPTQRAEATACWRHLFGPRAPRTRRLALDESAEAFGRSVSTTPR